MRIVLGIIVIALVTLFASGAEAQCSFDAVAAARGMRASMIRGFAACPSSEHPVINAYTQGGVPACRPVLPDEEDRDSSPYSFDKGGGCSIQTRAIVEADCAMVEDGEGVPLQLRPGPCHVTYVKGKCKGIVQGDGVTPINADEDDFWSVTTLNRISLDDPINGDLTIIDFPMTFLFRPPVDGKISVSSSSAEALALLVGGATAALPTCTQIQLLDMTVNDPSGRPFAKLGGGTL